MLKTEEEYRNLRGFQHPFHEDEQATLTYPLQKDPDTELDFEPIRGGLGVLCQNSVHTETIDSSVSSQQASKS
jgi:hypothetical protein